ncbi:MAG: hypothetical protein IIZ19_01975 [Clostridia bacterium]|nr:hypothetical protein [Clostridia bacterium]
MPYIPEEHKKYPVLPNSRKRGGEVFQYNDFPEDKFLALVGEHLIPYGYDSYEEYFSKIDMLIKMHSKELFSSCNKQNNPSHFLSVNLVEN